MFLIKQHHTVSPKNVHFLLFEYLCQKLTNFNDFSMLNPEKIWHGNLTDLSTLPVRCSHFTLGNPKKSFSIVLFIHDYYDYFFDPGTQFPGNEKNTLCNTKMYKSWNEPYSSSSFTKQSCSKMALYHWIMIISMIIYVRVDKSVRRSCQIFS